jgi:hypothetical protein
MLSSFKSIVKNALFSKSLPVVKSNNKSNVVVLILGWGGSVPKNFGRVQRHYESRGITTILHTMPLLCPKFIRKSFEDDIEREVIKQCDTIKKERSDQVVFHVHLYSQNGSWVYSALTKRGNIPTPHKLIMDSAPHLQYTRDASYEASALSQLFTSLVLNKAQYYQFPFTPIARGAIFCIMSLSVLTDKLFPFKYHFFTDYISVHKHLRDHSPVIPTLFVYSSGDLLIPPSGVRAYKQAIEARGTPTHEKVFGDEVSHISASYKYPDQYVAMIDEFFELRAIPSSHNEK